MIYTIEKRYEFGNGSMAYFWGIFKYQERLKNGMLYNGTRVKRYNKRADAEKYCARRGIKWEEY